MLSLFLASFYAAPLKGRTGMDLELNHTRNGAGFFLDPCRLSEKEIQSIRNYEKQHAAFKVKQIRKDFQGKSSFRCAIALAC